MRDVQPSYRPNLGFISSQSLPSRPPQQVNPIAPLPPEAAAPHENAVGSQSVVAIRTRKRSSEDLQSETEAAGSTRGKRPRRSGAESRPETSTGVTESSAETGRRRPSGTLFACPFYKRNPLGHAECLFKQRLKTTSYVKQHIERSHSKWFCPTCFAEFADEDLESAHVKSRACIAPQEIPNQSDWVSKSCLRPLDVLPKSASPKERYDRIFGLLFPGTPYPASPYVFEDPLEEMMDLFCKAANPLNRNSSSRIILTPKLVMQEIGRLAASNGRTP